MQVQELVSTIAVITWVPLCFLVASAAKNYYRSPTGWFALALVFSPPIAYIFLLVADVPHRAVLRQQRLNRVSIRHPHRKDAREAAHYEGDCPNCGAAVNLSTGDGLHSPKGEPWRPFCDGCQTEIDPDGFAEDIAP